MKPIRVHYAHGTWWLTFKEAQSRCMEDDRGNSDPVTKRGRKWIYISNYLEGEELLEVIFHELGHTADPRAGEEAIFEQAIVMARVIHQLPVEVLRKIWPDRRTKPA